MLRSLIVSVIIIFVFAFVTSSCQPPGQGGEPGIKAPTSQQIGDVVAVAQDLADEFKERSRPKHLKSWVASLKVKAQPGKKFEQIALLKEGEIVEYLYQRTFLKESFELRGQRYEESWYLIQTKNGITGWVHGGGVLFVQADAVVAKNDAPSGSENQRTRSSDPNKNPAFVDKMTGDEPKEDYTFIPGLRVGSIKLNSSEDELVRIYGSKIGSGTIRTSGTKTEPCTILMPGSYNEISITWKDDSRSKVKAVYISNPNGKWHSPEGVQVGTSLSDLSKINRQKVNFYGFDWEYAGVVESFNKGSLGPLSKKFYLALTPAHPTATKQQLAGFKGNKIFSSQGAGVAALELEVKRIVVYLD